MVSEVEKANDETSRIALHGDREACGWVWFQDPQNCLDGPTPTPLPRNSDSETVQFISNYHIQL
jgi:hypothetical protein